jgi:hypothetical protein
MVVAPLGRWIARCCASMEKNQKNKVPDLL